MSFQGVGEVLGALVLAGEEVGTTAEALRRISPIVNDPEWPRRLEKRRLELQHIRTDVLMQWAAHRGFEVPEDENHITLDYLGELADRIALLDAFQELERELAARAVA